MELSRNVLNARVRVAFHLDRHEGWHFASEETHEVEGAPGARHLNLPIETAHGGRAVVALEQSQFHVLFGARVPASALDHGVEVLPVNLGECGVDVEDAIVPAPTSGAVSDPIRDHVLVVDLQLYRASATSNDSGQRAATEVQVEIVVAQANIETTVPACPEDGSTWAMKEVPEERVRQASPELPAHSPVSVVANM